MYNQTITLFNRLEGNEGDTWFPTILHNVHLETDRAAIAAKYGAEAADGAVLHIRYKEDGGEKMVQGKPWLPPKAWEKLLDHTKSVTFTPGDRFDFFWVGDWGNEDPVYDADYTGTVNYGFYKHMNKNHDFVFAITSVGGPYRVIPHFEIMGK